MSSIIYNFISENQIKEITRAFHESINLPISILDEEGNVIEFQGKKAAYCKHFNKYAADASECKAIHMAAAKRAEKLGDAYIFSCHSGLSHIVLALVSKNVLIGYVLIGPFIMEDLSSAMIAEVSNKYPNLDKEVLLQLYDDSFDLDIVEPSNVTQISRLAYYLFDGFVKDSKEKLVINQQKAYQQSMISESIQLYKTGEHSPNPNYPFEKESQLVAKLKGGNLEEAKKRLNDLLAFMISNINYSVVSFRNRAIEISSVMARIAIGSGANQKNVFEISDYFLSRIFNYTTIEDICFVLQEMLASYYRCMFPISHDSGNRQIREAMNFISSYFHENITLQDVASQVCLNETYFSRLFHQATGLTFKDYLTKVRIDEAKRLLKNTEYQLMEIAIAIGYNDQSYFSRIFKAKTGMSPSDYRNS